MSWELRLGSYNCSLLLATLVVVLISVTMGWNSIGTIFKRHSLNTDHF